MTYESRKRFAQLLNKNGWEVLRHTKYYAVYIITRELYEACNPDSLKASDLRHESYLLDVGYMKDNSPGDAGKDIVFSTAMSSGPCISWMDEEKVSVLFERLKNYFNKDKRRG